MVPVQNIAAPVPLAGESQPEGCCSDEEGAGSQQLLAWRQGGRHRLIEFRCEARRLSVVNPTVFRFYMHCTDLVPCFVPAVVILRFLAGTGPSSSGAMGGTFLLALRSTQASHSTTLWCRCYRYFYVRARNTFLPVPAVPKAFASQLDQAAAEAASGALGAPPGAGGPLAPFSSVGTLQVCFFCQFHGYSMYVIVHVRRLCRHYGWSGKHVRQAHYHRCTLPGAVAPFCDRSGNRNASVRRLQL